MNRGITLLALKDFYTRNNNNSIQNENRSVNLPLINFSDPGYSKVITLTGFHTCILL